MGGISATILIGSEAGGGSEIFPGAMIMLQEGDNPSWNPIQLPGFSQELTNVKSFYWKVMDPHTIMKDGLLMLATYVVRDPTILAILKKTLGLKEIVDCIKNLKEGNEFLEFLELLEILAKNQLEIK